MRTGGRRSRNCITAGVAATTSTPAAQPKSTIVARPKTKASETPFASRSSTGTGKRSASREAARKAPSPASAVALWAVVAKETAATTTVITPAMQTGATTGVRLGRLAAGSVIATPLPLEEVRAFNPAERECENEQREQGQQNTQARLPLQHSRPPSPSRTWRFSRAPGPGPSPGRGSRRLPLLTGKTGFGQRPPAPREALFVPTGELGQGDAVARGMDEPAVAEVDARVIHLPGLRSWPVGAPEEHVGGLEVRERDAPCGRHLAAHREGRPSLEGGRECGATRIGLELVDAPDEPRAIEAPAGLDAERSLRLLARSAPDVGVADEAGCGLQHPVLPRRESGQHEGVCELLDLLRLPVAEAQDLGGRVRGFRASRRLTGEQLERVELSRMIRAQAEQPRNDLGAEPAGRGEPGAPRRGGKLRRRGREPKRAYERCIELRHRHGARGLDGASRWPLREEAGDEGVECAARQRVVGVEGLDALRHQAVRDDDLDLRLRPRGRLRLAARLRGGRRREHGENSADRKEAAHPAVRI